jgi:prevent-host-death family protein
MSKIDKMDGWLTGDAKQRFSEVLRRCETEPQPIYRRDRLVAVVISAEAYEEFERWRESRHRLTLADAFGEVRELCAHHDYELDTGERDDREAWDESP